MSAVHRVAAAGGPDGPLATPPRPEGPAVGPGGARAGRPQDGNIYTCFASGTYRRGRYYTEGPPCAPWPGVLKGPWAAELWFPPM